MNLFQALIIRALFKPAPGLNPGQLPGNLDTFWAEMDTQARQLRARHSTLKYVRIAASAGETL
jgi:hypothetical protein